MRWQLNVTRGLFSRVIENTVVRGSSDMIRCYSLTFLALRYLNRDVWDEGMMDSYSESFFYQFKNIRDIKM